MPFHFPRRCQSHSKRLGAPNPGQTLPLMNPATLVSQPFMLREWKERDAARALSPARPPAQVADVQARLQPGLRPALGPE